MKRIQPKSIYPPSELRIRLEGIAETEGRSFNQQVVRFLRTAVKRYDRRREQKGAKLCHA